MQIVGRDEQRAAVLAEVGDEISNMACIGRIKPGGGLVEEDDRGFVHQRTRERESLTQSFRECPRDVALAIREPNQRQGAIDGLSRPRQSVESGVQ